LPAPVFLRPAMSNLLHLLTALPSQILKFLLSLLTSLSITHKKSVPFNTLLTSLTPTHPPLSTTSYTSSLNTAKNSQKFMIVYLHSPFHPACPDFCRDVIGSDEWIRFCREKDVLFWGASVGDGEGYQVAKVLNATAYPFTALISQSRSQMRVLDRVSGTITTAALISRFTTHISRLEPELVALRSDRLAREGDRRIRQMQDEAYSASLAADREKEIALDHARRALEEKTRDLEEAERKRRENVEKRRGLIDGWKKWFEVEAENTADHAKLSIRLSNGDRVVRSFHGNDRIELVRQYVMTLEPHIEAEYDVVCMFPRAVLGDGLSVKESGLWPNGSVVVEQRLWDDEDP